MSGINITGPSQWDQNITKKVEIEKGITRQLGQGVTGTLLEKISIKKGSHLGNSQGFSLNFDHKTAQMRDLRKISVDIDLSRVGIVDPDKIKVTKALDSTKIHVAVSKKNMFGFTAVLKEFEFDAPIVDAHSTSKQRASAFMPTSSHSAQARAQEPPAQELPAQEAPTEQSNTSRAHLKEKRDALISRYGHTSAENALEQMLTQLHINDGDFGRTSAKLEKLREQSMPNQTDSPMVTQLAERLVNLKHNIEGLKAEIQFMRDCNESDL